nr:uncharacterized protein LOC109190185 [Ipomoea trifida]
MLIPPACCRRRKGRGGRNGGPRLWRCSVGAGRCLERGKQRRCFVARSEDAIAELRRRSCTPATPPLLLCHTADIAVRSPSEGEARNFAAERGKMMFHASFFQNLGHIKEIYGLKGRTMLFKISAKKEHFVRRNIPFPVVKINTDQLVLQQLCPDLLALEENDFNSEGPISEGDDKFLEDSRSKGRRCKAETLFLVLLSVLNCTPNFAIGYDSRSKGRRCKAETLSKVGALL